MDGPFQDPRVVRYDEHLAKRGRVVSESIEEIKAWRTKEAEAGRPSGFDDYCRLHGLCPDCHASGLVRSENGLGYKLVGMDGKMYLFELCPQCDGTGRVLNR